MCPGGSRGRRRCGRGERQAFGAELGGEVLGMLGTALDVLRRAPLVVACMRGKALRQMLGRLVHGRHGGPL